MATDAQRFPAFGGRGGCGERGGGFSDGDHGVPRGWIVAILLAQFLPACAEYSTSALKMAQLEPS